MNKAFTKESDGDDEPEDTSPSSSLPANATNYVTPFGFSQMQDELRHLSGNERPKVVTTLKWAAGNGDRSENGDYIYSKKRLREIDRRLRYLTRRLENAKIINPEQQQTLTKVFFGATVTYQQSDGTHKIVKIVGVDEADITQNKISWISPIAKALLKSEVGDVVKFNAPAGLEVLEILEIKY